MGYNKDNTYKMIEINRNDGSVRFAGYHIEKSDTIEILKKKFPTEKYNLWYENKVLKVYKLDNINGFYFYFINNRFNINILHEDKSDDLSIDLVAEFVIGVYKGETFPWGKVKTYINPWDQCSSVFITYFNK